MCKIVEDYAKEYGLEQRIEGRLEGKLEGKLEGRIEGERKGKLEGKLEIIKNMLNDGLSLDKALGYAGLDVQTYERYLAEQ